MEDPIGLRVTKRTEPPQPYGGGRDSGAGYWFPNNDQFDPQSQFEHNPHPFKRPRNSEEDQSNSSNSMPYQSTNVNGASPRVQPQNGPNNPKGIGNIFFKTRFCAKFKQGMCRNGESCNFAHGNDDLRQPPPNWQEIVAGATGGRVDDRAPPMGNWDDDQKIIHRLKLCKKFYKGEECPYGDRCNFIHEDPGKLSDDSGRFRESSAISIGTTGGPVMVNGNVSNVSEGNRLGNVGADAFRKPTYWKTKLCTKFETTGQCPFGEKCHFAHGLSELQAPGVRVEVEAGNTGGVLLARSQSAPSIGASPSVSASAGTTNEEGQGKKCLLKCNGSKKINRIYADWLDDMPLAHNLPNQVES